KTVAVCNAHDLGSLAAFGFAHQTPPFLAGTNVPSTKHSFRSKPPASRRCSANLSSIFSITPERTQFWKRRCTVWYAPYRGGKSCHGAPVLKIHNAPSKALRRSLHGRPRPSARTVSSGKMLSTIFHCSSVKRIPSHSTLTIKVQAHIYEMASSDTMNMTPNKGAGANPAIAVLSNVSGFIKVWFQLCGPLHRVAELGR